MLRKLISASDEGVSHRVVTLLDNEADDIPISGLSQSLSITTIKDLPRAAKAYRAHIRKSPPDVILAWMYHSCLFAQTVTPKQIPVAWNIRHSLAELKREKLGTRFTILACARFSCKAKTIIYCSQNAIPNHERLGFESANAVFIPNGFDLSAFRPYGPQEKALLRKRFGLPSDAFIFGQAVRFHPMKDQASLFRAFGDIARKDPGVHLVLAGKGMTPGNPDLMRIFKEEKLQGRVTFLGLQEQMVDVFNCFDVYVSTSLWGEGFPNVIGEAMACGIPCIATDVGDSAAVVGPYAFVVERGNPALVSDAMMRVRSFSKQELESMQRGARCRIADRYAIDFVRLRYNEVLRAICN